MNHHLPTPLSALAPTGGLLQAFPGAACRYERHPDGSDRFVEMNGGCVQLWELETAALAANPGAFWDMVSAEDLAGLRASFETSAGSLVDWTFDWRITTPSGQTKWLHGTGRPERLQPQSAGWWLFISDITHSRRAQWAAREHSDRFKQMLDGIANVSVQGYGLDLTTRYWNKASEKLYGFTAQEAIGKNLIDLIIPEGMRSHVLESVVKMVRTGEPIPAADLVLLHKNGSPVEVFSCHAYVHLPGSDPELYCIDIDLSERRSAEHHRNQLEAQLRETRKWEALGSLADGVAHDFNSIAMAVLGNAELALSELPAQGPARTSVEEIHKAGLRAKSLVKQIFAFSHRREPQRQPVMLQGIVERASGLIQERVPAHIQVQVRCDPNAPPVLGDSDELQQVLFNFCANAWQAMAPNHPGRIALALDAFDGTPPLSPFTWSAPPLGDRHNGLRWTRLKVIDNGTGMDQATRERIFEPFFTTKPPGHGAGLGLTVVHTILAKQGAVLDMQSAPGAGSTFTIYWPACAPTVKFPPSRATPSQPVEAQADGLAEGEAADQARKRHIMFVNGDKLIAFLMKRLLEKGAYQVSAFVDSTEALKAFCRQPGEFDLVISDQDLPGLSGLEFARALKARSPGTPVALAAEFLPASLRRDAPAAGINELIEKPDSVEALFDIIDRLAKKCAAGAEASLPSSTPLPP